MKSFKIKKQGYDRFEVDTEMTTLQDSITSLEQQLHVYKRQNQQVAEQVVMIKNRYNALVSELSAKEKAADRISRLALKEANTVIDTAKVNADSIIREALSTARLILVEIDRIGNESKEIKEELRINAIKLQETIESLDIPQVWGFNWDSIDEEQDTSGSTLDREFADGGSKSTEY